MGSASSPRPENCAPPDAVYTLLDKSSDRLFALASPLIPPQHRHRNTGEKLHKIGDILEQGSGARIYRTLLSAGFQHPGALVPGGREVPGAIGRVFGAHSQLGHMERMMLADQLEYLPDDLLAKVDRVSMATSLEVRVPLLDHRVTEFAWRLPRRFKVRDGQTKWLLRQLLYRRVPREMIERPKMGFSVPIDRWLRGSLREWADDLLSPESLAASGALDVGVARRAWFDFLHGNGRVSGMAIWALVNFQAWHRRWR